MCRPDLQAYIDINTLNEVKAKALLYTQAYNFTKVQTKSVTDTLTLPYDAVADTVAEVDSRRQHWPL